MVELKKWKASVWLYNPKESEQVFYGESLVKLRSNIFEWLILKESIQFSNVNSNDEITQRYIYTKVTSDNPLKIQINDDVWEEPKFSLITSGWSGMHLGSREWKDDYYKSIEKAAKDFLLNRIIIYKSIDWEDSEASDNEMLLYRTKTVKKVRTENSLNKHFLAGWYLLSIDHVEDNSGKISEFIIGHMEDYADKLV